MCFWTFVHDTWSGLQNQQVVDKQMKVRIILFIASIEDES